MNRHVGALVLVFIVAAGSAGCSLNSVIAGAQQALAISSTADSLRMAFSDGGGQGGGTQAPAATMPSNSSAGTTAPQAKLRVLAECAPINAVEGVATTLQATVKFPDGSPAVSVPVTFYLADGQGRHAIGIVPTDGRGVASQRVIPSYNFASRTSVVLSYDVVIADSPRTFAAKAAGKCVLTKAR